MKKNYLLLLISLTLSCTLSAQVQLELPDGFEATVFADDLGPGRHLVVRDNGDVYLQLRETTKGSTVALRDEDNDGKADVVNYFGNLPGTGIEIRNGYLYTSTDTSIQRYAFSGDRLLPETSPELVVGGFSQQNQHAAKPFTFDGGGKIKSPADAVHRPTGIAVGPGGSLYVVDSRKGTIWKISYTK